MENVVKVLAFVGARDVLGASEIRLELDAACTADELMDQLCARYPALVSHRPSLRMAVNESYVRGGDPVRPGDDVALIPPVAGG